MLGRRLGRWCFRLVGENAAGEFGGNEPVTGAATAPAGCKQLLAKNKANIADSWLAGKKQKENLRKAGLGSYVLGWLYLHVLVPCRRTRRGCLFDTNVVMRSFGLLGLNILLLHIC